MKKNLLFVAVLCSLHCSSTVDPSASSQDELQARRTKLDSLCKRFWNDRCEEHAACLPDDFHATYKRDDDCVTTHAAACIEAYSGAAVNAKPADVEACFRAYGKLSCAQLTRFLDEDNPPQPSACALLPKGALTDGEACQFDAACAGGACVHGNVCGTCATRHPNGEACSDDATCQPGLTCGSDGKCAPYGEAGASCAIARCNSGLHCIGGTCTVPLADGAACDPDALPNPCNSTNQRVCNATTKTCTVAQLSREGEACSFTRLGPPVTFRGSCAPGLRCALNAVRSYCVREKRVGDGCFFADGPNGSECVDNADCVDGVCVQRTANVCNGYKAPPPFTGPNPGHLPVVPDLGGPKYSFINYVTVTFAGYPHRDHVAQLGDAIFTSGWFATVGADYHVGDGIHRGAVELPDLPPGGSTITNEAVQDILVSKIKDGSLPKPDAFRPNDAFYYQLYLPSTLVVSGPPYGTTCGNVAAFHDVVAYPYQFAYGVVADCGARGGLSAEQLIDTAASHELIEAATDGAINLSPAYLFADDGDPWNGLGGEVTDMCTGNYLPVSGGFLMGRSWSSSAAVSGSNPCVPLDPSDPVYYNMVSDQNRYSADAGTTLSVPLTAWSSGSRADWALGTRVFRATVPLSTTAVAIDKATINAGGAATLTVQIPASAPHGAQFVVDVTSVDPQHPPYQLRHNWPIAIRVP